MSVYPPVRDIMKQLVTALLLISIFIGCEDQISIVLEEQPGSVSGRIYPIDSNAKVGLYQGVIKLIVESTIESDGSFLIEEVPTGDYLLRVSASGFGSQEIKNINVEDGFGVDIGELLLTTLPWPIESVFFEDGTKDIAVRYDFPIYFRLPLDGESAEEAVTVTPVPPDLKISYSEGSSSESELSVRADWDYSTKYTIELSTLLKTKLGRQLEFPFTTSFTTEPFWLFNFHTQSSGNFNSFITIAFNGNITESNLYENIVFTPGSFSSITLENNTHRISYANISPDVVWPTGNTLITIKGGLAEEGGVTLGSDTTIILEMNKLSITETFPINRQISISISDDIHIIFNTLINESSAQTAFSITPEVPFSVTLNSGNQVVLNLLSLLQDATTYTVTVNSTLTDFWGVPFEGPYDFSFTTK